MTYLSTILADSPVSYWRLDDVASTVVDQQASNTGTINGVGITQNVSGAVIGGDAAMLFPGTLSDFVSVPDAASLSPEAGASGLVSVECWVNPTSSLTAVRYIAAKIGAANFEYSFSHDASGFPAFTVWTSAAAIIGTAIGSAAMVVGPWYHLVGTYDRLNQLTKLYTNGALVATNSAGTNYAAGTATDGTTPLTIGKRSVAGAGAFFGKIDEFAIYASALTQTQVSAHYNAAFAISTRSMLGSPRTTQDKGRVNLSDP